MESKELIACFFELKIKNRKQSINQPIKTDDNKLD